MKLVAVAEDNCHYLHKMIDIPDHFMFHCEGSVHFRVKGVIWIVLF
jgi:hypothetical protein